MDVVLCKFLPFYKQYNDFFSVESGQNYEFNLKKRSFLEIISKY